MMQWTPLSDRLIVRPFTPITREKGQRIMRTDQGRERPQHGQVLSAGPKVEGVTPGDIIAYGRYAGVETPVDGQKLLIVRETEIMAKADASTVELTTHDIKDGDVLVTTLVHEAHAYCDHCDPLSADAAREEQRAASPIALTDKD